MSGMPSAWSVSVVIPVFNRAAFIAEAVESARAQTLPPDEILVVDDGSTDNTAAVVSRFGEPVRLIRIANTGVGPSRPRNIGIAAARSSYITLLDSDDVLLATLLERRKDLFARHPELGLVFNRSYVGERTAHGKTAPILRADFEALRACCTDPLADDTYILPSQRAYSACCRGNYFLTATGTTFPKKVWEEVGRFDDTGSFTTANDYDFFFRVAARYDIGYLDIPLQIYYQHDSNISHANRQETFRPHIHLNDVRLLERELKRAALPEDRAALRRLLRTEWTDLGYVYRKIRRYRNSLGAYWKCFGYGGLTRECVSGIFKVPAAWLLDHVWDGRRGDR
jgi:glycosyltransferase involved in cell wall biosynthesis